MKAFLAVARREIEEKRFVFAAAALASFLPFAVPLVRGLHGNTAAEARDWLAVMLASTFGAGLAIALGGTIISSDLVERRMGFYFSRPVTGFAIWSGKLGAAVLIALATAAIVYVPTLAVNRGRIILIDLPQRSAEMFVLGVVAAAVLCHAVGVALRTRFALLAADIIAFVLTNLALAAVLQQFARAFALEALRRAITLFAALAGAALLVAGIVSVTRGRSDGRAAHWALSVTLWSLVAVGVAAIAGYSAWVLSATPNDVRGIDDVLPASSGTFAVLQGEARGAEPVFLFDTSAAHRYRRAGGDWRWPVLSPDGKRAAWFEPVGSGGPSDVVTWRLDDPDSRPMRTNLSLSTVPATAFLSDHGESLATIESGLLSVYDIASSASLGSVRLGKLGGLPRGFFLDRHRFRLFRETSRDLPAEKRRLEICEFDASKKQLSITGAIEDVESIAFSASLSGDRLLVREKSRLALRDGRSGQLLASLAERGSTNRPLGRFVSDGRIVVSVADQSGVRVEVFAPDGGHERTIRIPARDRIALGGEAAPGRLVVAAGGDSKRRENRTIFLVDLSSGEVRQVADHLFPVAYLAGWISSRPNYEAEPGSEATKLFYGPGRSLVHFDPLTGERRVILAGSSR